MSPSRFSYATGISDDGSIIVGQSEYGGSYVRRPVLLAEWLNSRTSHLVTNFNRTW